MMQYIITYQSASDEYEQTNITDSFEAMLLSLQALGEDAVGWSTWIDAAQDKYNATHPLCLV
jgi:hypothetical protein